VRVSAAGRPPAPPSAWEELAVPEPPRARWGLGKRFLLAALGVVLLSAGATAVVALNEVSKVVEALGQNRAVKLAPKVLAPTSRGAPETLLLVGDDRRPPPKGNPNGFVVPHSNEMLLVRIDPSKPTISMLSIPRELRVTIQPPGARPVVNRINVAYTIGGIQLMTETIKQVLGISVNHVFVVTFPKFKRAVNEMGCVYLTVDRRYFHVNEPGGEQYFEINLQPGYQRICGTEALEFVANRHEDTSLTRDARDQRFLLETKAQYGPTLFEDRERFERILGRAVETDLHGSGGVLDLLELLVDAQGKPVRQVPFNATLGISFDTASQQQIAESVRSFMTGTAPVARHRVNQAVRAAGAHPHGAAPGLTLGATPLSEIVQARTAAPNLPFPLEYPRARMTYGGAAPATLRLYDIRDQQGRLHRTYVIVLNSGPLGAFYDVQGTAWSDPPLLANPGQSIRLGSRTYQLFYAGEQIRTIAWHEGSGTYWIENTLTNSIPPRAMLAMAVQTAPVVGSVGAAPQTVVPSSLNVPPRPAAPASTTASVGALVGFAILAPLALLALGVLSRQRELRGLREQVALAMSVEARERWLLSGRAGAAVPVGARAAVPVGAGAGATAGAALPGGATAGAAVFSGGGATTGAAVPSGRPAPAIYRSRRGWRRRVLPVAGGVLLAIIVVAGARVLGFGSSSGAPASAPVPVAVFNATNARGASHAIVATLTAHHVRLGKVASIRNANLGHGAFVLYPPGSERQARAVARLIGNLSPTVAAIEPQVENALGRRGQIVILLD
jgi:LCP family protein required for cell wall assembly